MRFLNYKTENQELKLIDVCVCFLKGLVEAPGCDHKAEFLPMSLSQVVFGGQPVCVEQDGPHVYAVCRRLEDSSSWNGVCPMRDAGRGELGHHHRVRHHFDLVCLPHREVDLPFDCYLILL